LECDGNAVGRRAAAGRHRRDRDHA
jgi:hypothetical protein